MKRYTFVGYLPCGHVNFLAADPSYVLQHFPQMSPEDRLDEWRSLVKDLAHYIKHGRVQIMDDVESAALQLELCDCAGKKSP